VPGAGQSANGYMLTVERAELDLAGGGLDLDLQALWDQPEGKR
jgi:hypothetical protein